jgi:hypothetical protein
VALLIQRTKRVRRIILSSMACTALLYFSIFSDKRHGFWGKVIENKMYILIFSTTLSETFPIRRRCQRDIDINVQSLHVKYTLLLSDFNDTLNYSTGFR